ncbi:MmcQ/YjbR family DNA-binding protein [Salinarimonas rosea]|uniref:MmcQ/YjbR family DNA-binding protein n=1 Tax=Salinarimonas rosea TaxID=552063 RepID=UPI000405F654|nr:MmcQ/YjbR family DNA-binding protein [Salinarimonas rosea]
MMEIALRQRVAAICARLPGAEVSDPWGGGHDAWKVGGKMFACIGAVTPGVAVKCVDVETAQMLIEAGVGARAPYFHRSWLLLPEDVPEDELAHRVAGSYDLVRAKLPRRLVAALPAREGA